MIRRTVLFSGRVQGVGFRYTACRIASRFRVTGYVKNLPDGRVELVVESEPPEAARFVEAISDEMGEYVRDAQQQDAEATGEFHRFDVRF